MQRASQWIADAVDGDIHGPAVTVTGSVVTDSRLAQPGSLYVARPGHTADGHAFVDAAQHQGAVAAIVEHVVTDASSITQIVVPDATKALGDLARAHLADLRNQGPIDVIGVTGSAGKTTTKDLLARLLTADAPTIAPEQSFNNEVGVPLTVLRADESTRHLVLEMGASGPGHLTYLTSIAPLDIAVELMVGTAHLGGFGSREGIAQAKQELVEGLRPSGTAVLNADDAYVMRMAAAAPGPVVTFSWDADTRARVSASGVETDAQGRAHFILSMGHHSAAVRLHLVGVHHVHNALAAAAVADVEGMSVQAVAAILSEALADSPHRMDVSAQILAGHPLTLIDDAYNANEDSMVASLEAARRIAGEGRVVAVLGEMLELGPASSDIHQHVGQRASALGVAEIIGLGQGAVGYRPENMPESFQVASTPEQAISLLGNVVRDGDTVLVKGSNGSGAWKVADKVRSVGA